MTAATRISERLSGRAALVIGRAGMDIYPVPDGTRIEDAESLVTDVGGSSGNIALAGSCCCRDAKYAWHQKSNYQSLAYQRIN